MKPDQRQALEAFASCCTTDPIQLNTVTGVVVTRGDVLLADIIARLTDAFGEHVIVWDNSRGMDLRPFGQFVAALHARTEWIFFQDDDCLVDAAAIAAKRQPGKIVCNMPAAHQANYVGEVDRLMGFGSVFERSRIIPTFGKYFRFFPPDELLLREPGRLFTGLNECEVVDLGVEHLPWADAPNRLWRQPEHTKTRDEMRERVLRVRELGR